MGLGRASVPRQPCAKDEAAAKAVGMYSKNSIVTSQYQYFEAVMDVEEEQSRNGEGLRE